MACLRVILALAILALSAVSRPLAQQEPIRHDFEADLRARHPEIAVHSDFMKWLDGKQVGPWHETRLDADRRRTVVVQNASGDNIFAALVSLAPVAADERRTASVQRTANVDLAARAQTRAQALAAPLAKWAPSSLRATRPVVDFLPDGTVDFGWEFEVAVDSKVETYRLEGKALQLKSFRQLPRLPKPLPRPLPKPFATASAAASDPAAPAAYLATDDLHHPGDFAAEATNWTANLATVQEKARRILDELYGSYSYDANIVHIINFTWSDLLTRDRNGRAGVCDEFTVVGVTYLRAIGIPARVKLLVWIDASGKTAAHAALEYSDGGAWRHMDPTWNRLNDAAYYRNTARAKDVTVMDADDPLDARSNGDAWGAPDVKGDGRLHPYDDFKINPAYPGNSRSGYSK